MESFSGSIRWVRRLAISSSNVGNFNLIKGRSISGVPSFSESISSARNEVGDLTYVGSSVGSSNGFLYRSLRKFTSHSSLALRKPSITTELLKSSDDAGMNLVSLLCRGSKPAPSHQSMALQASSSRCITTMTDSGSSISEDSSASISGVAPRIKFKRLDKTARHIMQILDKEAVEEVKKQKEIPDIQPGHIIQLKVEVPENKRRVSILKGIVIARRNAGLNTTFRLRRLVAGVGVESLFPLYSPNIKEIKVLDKKKVRRAKLYYLRDRLNPLKK